MPKPFSSRPCLGGDPVAITRSLLGLYLCAGFEVTLPPIFPVEGAAYGACLVGLGPYTVAFRVGKRTPVKQGFFTTLWKRPLPKAPIAPLDQAEGIDFVVVYMQAKEQQGLFVLPQKRLSEQGIISVKGEGGRRAMRLYPPWEMGLQGGARGRQAWQKPYFLALPSQWATLAGQAPCLLATLKEAFQER